MDSLRKWMEISTFEANARKFESEQKTQKDENDDGDDHADGVYYAGKSIVPYDGEAAQRKILEKWIASGRETYGDDRDDTISILIRMGLSCDEIQDILDDVYRGYEG